MSFLALIVYISSTLLTDLPHPHNHPPILKPATPFISTLPEKKTKRERTKNQESSVNSIAHFNI